MKIPVIFAADKDYVEQLGVVVTSLLYNAKKDTFYEVYILHNDAREKLEEKVNSVKNLNYNNENFKQANFTYIDMSNNNEIKKFNYHSHAHLQNTRAWAYRLIIAELEELKEWEKVIYLDSDIIIESDLEDLYKIDLEGNALGAVCEYNFLILQSFFWDSTHNQIKYWENILKIPKEKLKY
ncbi:MAG: hypothetical protein E7Y34_02825, partial [Mycoplasma sp.]|nr:hypothetical protein [Mycoplasma sp.]